MVVDGFPLMPEACYTDTKNNIRFSKIRCEFLKEQVTLFAEIMTRVVTTCIRIFTVLHA